MDHYAQALKAGRACYKENVSKGDYPYLLALDEMIPESDRYHGKDIGFREIPAEFIIGTKHASRTKSFARNFMPVLGQDTEFAGKWERLCQSHLQEGIRDPVQVWEYMNRFYVQEGNKRVSVLKYFGARTVPAYVRRIMPERRQDPDVQRYYEYLAFCETTGLQSVEFSSAGSYKELLAVPGMASDQWTGEERRAFTAIFQKFAQAYAACGGQGLHLTSADAFLHYIKIFGYKLMKEQSVHQMRKEIVKIWEELVLAQEESQIQVSVGPEEHAGFSLRGLMPKRTLQVAFLYGTSVGSSRWSANHDAGRIHLEKAYAGKVSTKAYVRDPAESPEDQLRRIIREGASLIFVTESCLIDPCVRVAVEFPEVAILNCSLNIPHRYIRTYYPRMYEAKFVTGAIAGALTQNGRVGYICKYPIFGAIAEINAFARGVSMVNPKALVYLEWSSVCGLKEAEARLRNRQIHLISYRDFYEEKTEMEVVFGLTDLCSFATRPIVLPVWNWGAFYEKITGTILNGTYKAEYKKTSRALNYYWGMSSGVVDILFSGELPRGVRYLGESLCRGIRADILHPFYRSDMQKDGRLIWENSDQSIRVEDIMNMSSLEDNIVGSIPDYNELARNVRPLVDAIGVENARNNFGGHGKI